MRERAEREIWGNIRESLIGCRFLVVVVFTIVHIHLLEANYILLFSPPPSCKHGTTLTIYVVSCSSRSFSKLLSWETASGSCDWMLWYLSLPFLSAYSSIFKFVAVDVAFCSACDHRHTLCFRIYKDFSSIASSSSFFLSFSSSTFLIVSKAFSLLLLLLLLILLRLPL